LKPECRCSTALWSALLSPDSLSDTDPKEALPTEYRPVADRLFVSFTRFVHLFDIGETHARELLRELDPPVRRSGRRLLIPVIGILRLADALPTGFSAEPESARRGREARGGRRPISSPGNHSGHSSISESIDQRVPPPTDTTIAAATPRPPLAENGGRHLAEPEHGSKKSSKISYRGTTTGEVA
jgi:hypothetical protein